MAMAVAQKFSHFLYNLRQATQVSPQPEPVFTVDRAQVPPLFWKPYIYAGYRPLHRTWRFYFRTLFQQHNEAVNVWTHLLAAVVLLLRLAIFMGTVDFWGDPHALPLFIIVLASFTYLSFSALAHLLQAKSEFWHYSFFFLDYVGVAVYQFGSALAHFYYAIEPAWHSQVQAVFLPTAAFLAWLSCTGSCYNKYIQKPGLLGRTCQEVPSAVAYALDISPVIHRILVSSDPATNDPALLYHKCQVVFFLLAAAFFSTVMPERWFPGSCHVFGQGHQLFHVFLVLCTLAQLEAVTLDYEARRPIYEPLHTRSPHNFAGLFLLTVVSSVLTAFPPDQDPRGPWCYVSGQTGAPEKRSCEDLRCPETTSQDPGASTTETEEEAPGTEPAQVFPPANALPARSEAAAVQPAVGISQRVRMNSKDKKDLGTLGYVLGITMMVIIIAIGAGIILGYTYKRGKDLKAQHEQKACEREMQRITLPLAAFTNPTCELVDEKTVVVHASQTPVGPQEGSTPLMGQAGTPGA